MNCPKPREIDFGTSLSLGDNPLAIDHWIAASWLQKAIRRGDVDLADEAAKALYGFRGKNTFKRLLIIAFEDVGIGSTAAVSAAVSMSCDQAEYRDVESEGFAAGELTRILATAQKDRSAELLISAINCHPSLAALRDSVGSMDAGQCLAIIADHAATLHRRAAATVAAAGFEHSDRKVFAANLDNVLSAFSDLDVPSQLLRVVRRAAFRTREPMAILLPLLWLALPLGRHETINDPVPATKITHGLPLYAFDKHTRLGKIAIHQLVRENADVRRVLAAHVAKAQCGVAACMAAFYADGAPISGRLAWPNGTEIEKLGLEGDLFRVGVPLEAAAPLVAAVRDNLDHLNDIRERLFLKHLGAAL